MTSIAAQVLIAPIRFYQRFITPYTPATCRYYPTCSAYAVTALRTRGAFIGTGLTIWRLLRCNPWSSGGVDHVPAKGVHRHLHDSEPEQAEFTRDDPTAAEQEDTDNREREAPPGSSLPATPAVHRWESTDLDAPRSAAPEPMIGRSAA
ncbi:MAG: membrane protein insertion efficiency factor YidD [Nakamurella sp.]